MMATRFKLTCLLAAGACLWLTLAVNADSASARILFDFASATNVPGWQVVNDNVMGGISSSKFEVTSSVAVFRGELSLENNGGFASVRSSPVQQNLTGLDAFVVRVRGDGWRYKFTVRTKSGFDTPIYQCAFTTRRGEWQEHRLAFKDFVPTFRGRVLSGQPPVNPTERVFTGQLELARLAPPGPTTQPKALAVIESLGGLGRKGSRSGSSLGC
jgi:monofunctional biosynthetic peptidoglycan transglycosylase